MSVMISGGGDFTPAPEGVHNAVCVDVVDLGLCDTTWGKKPKVQIVWELEAKMEDGKRFIIQQRYTASLHEKSNLGKDLKAWRGRAFTPEELKGFDLEKVLGAPCVIVVQHEEKDGTVYGNVQTVAKATQFKLTPSGQYVRKKDRQQQNGQQSHGSHQQQQQEEIPF